MERSADGAAFLPDRERCGAKTRDGDPCKNPAMANGRCRMHGGATVGAGAPPGNQNARVHGLRADYVRMDELATVFTDPVQRMQILANVMANRAVVAHAATVADPKRDTDATDERIARAVRTAAQATRVEIAARKAKAEDDEPIDEIIVTVRKIGDGSDS